MSKVLFSISMHKVEFRLLILYNFYFNYVTKLSMIQIITVKFFTYCIFVFFLRSILMLLLGTRTLNLVLGMRSCNGFWSP